VELEHVPAGAVPRLAPVVEALETDHPHDRLGVPLGTKSVTAAHPHGLPRLAVEDLAAVVETTREPAAAEAGAAWEAAG
jgi:hypothetical protein